MWATMATVATTHPISAWNQWKLEFLKQSHTHQPQMNYHSNNTKGRDKLYIYYSFALFVFDSWRSGWMKHTKD